MEIFYVVVEIKLKKVNLMEKIKALGCLYQHPPFWKIAAFI